MYSIYAIIVTYNGSKWVDKCFGSLTNSNIPLKIMAIDNGSRDGTPDLIRKKFPEIEVIETGENLGFGKANNIGLSRVLEENADFAFLLNQDAWVEESTIADLIGIYKENTEFGILSPLQLNGAGDKIDSSFWHCSVQKSQSLFFDYFMDRKRKKIYETSFTNAACWLLPIEIIKNIGGFDPLFGHYGEDDDYVYRCQYKNHKIGICPNQIVYHDREYRSKQRKPEQIINELYISHLLKLKSPKNPDFKRSYYFKKISHAVILYVFAPNKKFYKYQIMALFRILKIRKRAIENLNREKFSNPNYLVSA